MHTQSFVWCQEIARKGLTPNVALLRAQSNGALSVPQAISALRAWKKASMALLDNVADDSDIQPAESKQTQSDTPTLSDSRIATLEQRCHTLEQANAALNSRLIALEQQLASMLQQKD
ncbi:hypothetical protein [Alteromonas oceanisediminis]|uniref:hypothetical protein n=1 Tax=Alteromonas oceanisediminis TaxID=2836180 RepID=UPI001BDB0144|nr:hypothetical protein [Alteromonas oceanisediminis]MBT0585024.1 hypothetical protein [Alteromonas oceanisediminis]